MQNEFFLIAQIPTPTYCKMNYLELWLVLNIDFIPSSSSVKRTKLTLSTASTVFMAIYLKFSVL